ncbi:MAG: hypothetical protein AAF772_01720 [Acidobacteriota bacterium]
MQFSSVDRAQLSLNGIDGATGAFFQEPIDLTTLREVIRAESPPRIDRLAGQIGRGERIGQGLREGLDPRRLADAGWGVIFAANADADVAEALEPLLRHRQRQAGAHRAHRFRALSGRDGYRAGESKLRFLARHGVGSGPVDPDQMPFYLLLVGDPEAIPYVFQYQLDVQYAVGRVCFDDVDDYARYAETVVATETARADRARRRRRTTFFAVRNAGDAATEMAHDLLVTPLAQRLAREVPRGRVDTVAAASATRARLGGLLGGDETPDLLFTACHGLGFRQMRPEQRALQGALVCQKPGEGARAPIFGARDVDPNARLDGLIAFFFACFGAGTPQRNNFAHRGERATLSEASFVARLPQALLAHPKGGALAVVGHVDRAWTFSFAWPQAGAQFEVFASTLKRLLSGHPVGSAMEFFNRRYAELECDLADLRQRLAWGAEPDLLEEVGLWTARNDARNFMIVGDPAVRLGPLAAADDALNGAG